MILKIENGSFAYNKKSPLVFDGISAEAESGDVVAILGPNGAGKTTLLKCMMGLLKWKAGKSTIDGTDISHMSARELFSKLAYVPQSRNSSTIYTAEEMILLGRSSKYGVFSKPGEEDVKLAYKIMDELKITRLAKKKCSEMSGGELQMVLIARALAGEPQILVLDEPESNLDFKNQLIVMDTISRLAAGGMTIIFNTHYPAHALQRANKALLIGRGNHIFGKVSEVITEGNIESAFGVRTVIGEIETDDNVLRDVLPLEIGGEGELSHRASSDSKCIAALSIIVSDSAVSGERINSLMHDYSEYIIGRMGLPYEGGKHIISAVFEGPRGDIEELTSSLGMLPGVGVKATYADAERNQRDDNLVI